MGRHFKILTKMLALVNDLPKTANSCLHQPVQTFRLN